MVEAAGANVNDVKSYILQIENVLADPQAAKAQLLRLKYHHPPRSGAFVSWNAKIPSNLQVELLGRVTPILSETLGGDIDIALGYRSKAMLLSDKLTPGVRTCHIDCAPSTSDTSLDEFVNGKGTRKKYH